MEYIMNMAKSLTQKGKKQWEIAEALGVTDRTVRNYLTRKTDPKKKRSSLLDPYKTTIDSILNGDPYYNATILLKKIQADGYSGQISILRDYMKKIRDQLITEAVIRYETIPGLQAQVDWMELGQVRVGPSLKKRYAFVMVLGYSRRAFVCFTEAMTQSVLHSCHVAAFDYFGGVPEEILYDNMKTAFVYDREKGSFQPNKDMLKFAVHYGFDPKRCRVRRPQTKGKVERFIRYIRTNFIPQNPDLGLPLEDLDVRMLTWLEQVDTKVLRDFGMTREERFKQEAAVLRPLPAFGYDTRETHELVVHRDSTIVFEGNRYSVPPQHIRQMVTLKVDTRARAASVYSQNVLVREFPLEKPGSHARIMFTDDEAALKKIWKKQRADREQREALARRKKSNKEQRAKVDIRLPSSYDFLFMVWGLT